MLRTSAVGVGVAARSISSVRRLSSVPGKSSATATAPPASMAQRTRVMGFDV